MRIIGKDTLGLYFGNRVIGLVINPVQNIKFRISRKFIAGANRGAGIIPFQKYIKVAFGRHQTCRFLFLFKSAAFLYRDQNKPVRRKVVFERFMRIFGNKYDLPAPFHHARKILRNGPVFVNPS